MCIDIAEEYHETPLNDQTIDGAIEALENGVDTFLWRFTVHPDDEDTDDVCRLAMAAGDTWLIAEECPAYKFTRGLETIALRGRRRGVYLLATTQRPYTFSRTVASQCATDVMFHTDEPRDKDYVRQKHGTDAILELENLNPANFDVGVFGNVDLFLEHLGTTDKPLEGGDSEHGRNHSENPEFGEPYGDCDNDLGRSAVTLCSESDGNRATLDGHPVER